jgi:hypothetical protein
MRAIVLEKFGGLDSLVYADLPEPEPMAGQVVIEIKAFGLKHAELHMRRGEWAEVISSRPENKTRTDRWTTLLPRPARVLDRLRGHPQPRPPAPHPEGAHRRRRPPDAGYAGGRAPGTLGLRDRRGRSGHEEATAGAVARVARRRFNDPALQPLQLLPDPHQLAGGRVHAGPGLGSRIGMVPDHDNIAIANVVIRLISVPRGK